MNQFKPDFLLWVWQFVNLALLGLGLFTLVKFLIVLFKADKAIDEIREYIKQRS